MSKKPLIVLFFLQVFIWINQIDLKFSYFDFIKMYFLSIIPLFGIGYVIARIDLILRGVNKAIPILIFLMLGGMAIVEVSSFNYFSVLPFFSQIASFRLVFLEGKQFEFSWYMFLLANSFIYFFIGVYCFVKLEKIARQNDKFLSGVYNNK